MRSRSAELDESSLQEIFTRVGDAHDLASCSLVCKRWCDLCWGVSFLHINFTVRDWDRLEDTEAIVSRILRNVKKAAPGCLESLKITLACGDNFADKASGHWLAYAAQSVTELELDLRMKNGSSSERMIRWGPGLWSTLSCFHALENLKIRGKFDTENLLPVASESPFRSLTSCTLDGPTGTFLEALLTACPRLKYLDVSRLQCYARRSLELVSASLENLDLANEVHYQGWQLDISLDAPGLTILKIGMHRQSMKLRLMSPDNLCELELYGSCDLRCEYQLNKLNKLKISGDWETQLMVKALDSTPMVTDLAFESLKLDTETVAVGVVLSPLAKLKTVNFDGSAIKAFTGDSPAAVFEELTAHVWLDPIQTTSFDVLKDLLGLHRVQMLVVHYNLTEMLDTDSGFISENYQPWRVLFDLKLLFPGRIKFAKQK